MSILSRCVGWAQCPKCPRPDGDGPVPPGAEKARCAPYPVKSCPVAGAHCPPPLTCCSKTAAGELSHDCREFLPAKCSAMPAVNCSPNIPPSGWAVLAWKPSPAAYRNDPRTQKPSRPCGPGKPSAPALQQFPRRPCEARGLDAEATRRPLTLRHVPELPPVRIPTESLPCNPAPALPIHSTCCALGSRNRCGRVNFKFTFPGSEDMSSGRHVTCSPCLPCFQRAAFYNSELAPRPRLLNRLM